MNAVELVKVIILGIVQGITEWLPVSSTGHMILVDEFLRLDVSEAFRELFLVVIQFGSILAVVVLYWKRLFPFRFKGGFAVDGGKIRMWLQIALACLPAAIVGVLWDDVFNALFYNYRSVAVMLIVFGILFIAVERLNRGRRPAITQVGQMTWKAALWIGLFQMIAAIFPGTSRSGATIIGALMIGVSRTAAAEFTFFLAVPVMLGASALKLVRFGFAFSGPELVILLVGMAVAFVVSLLVIKLLMSFIKKHDFTVFGWYRIALGVVVLVYFWLQG